MFLYYASKTSNQMSMSAITLLCADIGLGKMDPSMLSDQDRMELFVANLAHKYLATFQTQDGTFLDMCEWTGMECDEDGNIFEVCLQRACDGTVCLEFFPESVDTIIISSNGSLEGTLNTSKLPSRLEVCELDGNNFDGVVDMTKLPKALSSLSVAQNDFSGECDLTALPSGLEALNASENGFSGSLCLDSLPKRMRTLDVSCNCLSGSISLENLPESLEELQISANSLTGIVRLMKAGSLGIIFAHSNLFSGEATIPREFASRQAHVTLSYTNITSVKDENGKVHPKENTFLTSP